MAKFFRFADRAVPIRFFEGQDEITVTLTISDQTDTAFVRGAELLKAGTESRDVRRRKELWTEAVDALIGKENREKILGHSRDQDCFALAEIYRYVVDAYGEAKVKNLSASAR